VSINIKVVHVGKEGEMIMKTKKLVIGVCLSVAITGTHKVFGEDSVDRPVGILSTNVSRRGLGEINIFEGMCDDEVPSLELALICEQKTHPVIEIALQRFGIETNILEGMCDDEVSAIENALIYEHKAHFIREFADRKLELACENFVRIEYELRDAINEVPQSFGTAAKRRETYAKIEKLKVELAEAFKHRMHMSREHLQSHFVANGYCELAQKCRGSACDMRTMRINSLEVLYGRWIKTRSGHSPEDDLNKVTNLENTSTAQLKEIWLRASQDFILLDVANSRLNYEQIVAMRIREIVQKCTDLKTWLYYILDGKPDSDCDIDTCLEFNKTYKYKDIGYSYDDLAPFQKQVDRLQFAFSKTPDIEGKAWSALADVLGAHRLTQGNDSHDD
jgi:hypothetical protein